jgi:hypothetical protein
MNNWDKLMKSDAAKIIEILENTMDELRSFQKKGIVLFENEILDIIRASQDIDSGISFILDNAKVKEECSDIHS